MSRPGLIVAAIVAAILSGCAFHPMTLQSHIAADTVEATSGGKPVARRHTCDIQLTGIADRRPNAGEIANLNEYNIHHKDLVGWLRSGLKSLEQQGIFIQPAPAGDVPADRPRIDVELLKAYMQFLATSKSANVVIKVAIERPKEPPVSRLYRGRDTSVNWWHSETELGSAFDTALRDALKRLAPDLLALCPAA